ncbi:hypothetical protein B0H17DRAFT_1183626 [Mycena rosella]|uniref:Uncharacterized protein n=1 Tax=Mycena rosella TaxID=1033263 RepID=A0AAD7G8V5_MYCRO|nr:hypothetical protein B0H17DRAFT_1183626 [Mycena rosella]
MQGGSREPEPSGERRRAACGTERRGWYVFGGEEEEGRGKGGGRKEKRPASAEHRHGKRPSLHDHTRQNELEHDAKNEDRKKTHQNPPPYKLATVGTRRPRVFFVRFGTGTGSAALGRAPLPCPCCCSCCDGTWCATGSRSNRASSAFERKEHGEKERTHHTPPANSYPYPAPPLLVLGLGEYAYGACRCPAPVPRARIGVLRGVHVRVPRREELAVGIGPVVYVLGVAVRVLVVLVLVRVLVRVGGLVGAPRSGLGAGRSRGGGGGVRGRLRGVAVCRVQRGGRVRRAHGRRRRVVLQRAAPALRAAEVRADAVGGLRRVLERQRRWWASAPGSGERVRGEGRVVGVRAGVEDVARVDGGDGGGGGGGGVEGRDGRGRGGGKEETAKDGARVEMGYGEEARETALGEEAALHAAHARAQAAIGARIVHLRVLLRARAEAVVGARGAAGGPRAARRRSNPPENAEAQPHREDHSENAFGRVKINPGFFSTGSESRRSKVKVNSTVAGEAAQGEYLLTSAAAALAAHLPNGAAADLTISQITNPIQHM